SDDAAELCRNTIGAAVVGAQCGKRNSTCNRDRGARARTAWCLRARRIVRVAHLPRQRAGAVAVISKVIGDGFAEYNGTRCAHARDLDRVATSRLLTPLSPLGARC